MNIDFNQIGLRLGMVVAGFTGGETEAAQVAGVSKCTLTRYLKGTKPQAQAAVLAKICVPHGINLNWLMYGPPHLQYINHGCRGGGDCQLKPGYSYFICPEKEKLAKPFIDNPHYRHKTGN